MLGPFEITNLSLVGMMGVVRKSKIQIFVAVCFRLVKPFQGGFL